MHVRKLSKLSVSYFTLVCYRTLSHFSYVRFTRSAACSLVPAALLQALRALLLTLGRG